jgi:serine/threonine protein kinase
MMPAGTVLNDRYVLRELIGRGGMGEVWRGSDIVLDRDVAVKVLLHAWTGDPTFSERFRAEARAMAALSDPNIVEIYDFGNAHGLVYLVMQFVPGEALHGLLQRVGPLPPADVMRIVAHAGRALHQAHLRGIVHRDVKPGNLLIRPDGRVVLTDFGVARMMGADRLTAPGEIFGTPTYLAPEQVTGGEIGPAVDIYALGIVAYECLTLRPPFVSDSPVGVALMQARDEPPPLPDSIPGPVRRVVMRALAKDPRLRWESAAAMAEAAWAAAIPPPGTGTPAASTVPVVAGNPPPDQPVREPHPSARIPVPPPEPARAARDRAAAEPRRRRSTRNRLIAASVVLVLLVAAGVWASLAIPRDEEQAGPPHPTEPTNAPATTAEPSGTPSASASPTPTADSTTTTPPPPQVPNQPAVTTTSAKPSPGPGQIAVPNILGRGGAEADFMLRAAGLVPQHTGPNTIWALCTVITQNPPEGTIVDIGSTVTFTTAPDTC